MDEKTANLGRRAVACKGWRWLPGMRWAEPDWVTPQMRREHLQEQGKEAPLDWVGGVWLGCGEAWRYNTIVDHYEYDPNMSDNPPEGAIPNLSDSATLGCLLALVREVHGDPHIIIDTETGPEGGVLWQAYDGSDSPMPRTLQATEAEALVAALEAA